MQAWKEHQSQQFFKIIIYYILQISNPVRIPCKGSLNLTQNAIKSQKNVNKIRAVNKKHKQMSGSWDLISCQNSSGTYMRSIAKDVKIVGPLYHSRLYFCHEFFFIWVRSDQHCYYKLSGITHSLPSCLEKPQSR